MVEAHAAAVRQELLHLRVVQRDHRMPAGAEHLIEQCKRQTQRPHDGRQRNIFELAHCSLHFDF